jgi:TRAP-type mannitol/chloroaromatic compound transport system permease small subunit
MTLLRKFMIAVSKINVFVGNLMVWVTILGVVVITFEVVMRYLFHMPTEWGHETMTLFFAIVYIMTGGYAHLYRAHVRVDVIYALLNPRMRAVLDLITSVCFFTFVGVLLWTSWRFYWNSQTAWSHVSLFGMAIPGEVSGTVWEPPLFGVKLMMPIGAALLLLQGVVWLIRDIHLVVTGKEMP